MSLIATLVCAAGCFYCGYWKGRLVEAVLWEKRFTELRKKVEVRE